MRKILIKKQLTEIFKGFFYNAKNSTAKSQKAIVWAFIGFGALMFLAIGGSMTAASIGLCAGLGLTGYGWMYFLLLGGIALLLGVAGSAFSTYSSVYIAKDNDQLLSLPIPVQDIIVARIMSVVLMDLLYTLPVLLPMYVVYLMMMGATVSNVICGLIYCLIIMLLVLVLSCFLGWVVAKVSTKIKNKSFVIVALSILLIGGYYFFYFKAQVWIRELVANIAIYGENVKGKAVWLYLFGSIGEGNWLPAFVCLLGALVLLLLTWLLLKSTFLSIATASGAQKKTVYRSKTVKGKSVFGAFLAKEFKLFTSDPTYMLNCGLGIILAVIGGVALLFAGRDLFELIGTLFGENPRDTGAIPLCAVIFLMSSVIGTAAPAVSLEGKSIWIAQSLPVPARTVLRAKAMTQFLLSVIPLLFLALTGIFTMNARIRTKLVILVFTVVVSAFMAVFDLFFGTKMANTSWTSSVTPIKQSGAVVISVFLPWAFVLAFAVPYLIFPGMEAWIYLAVWCVILAGFSVLIFRWLETKGAKHFEEL